MIMEKAPSLLTVQQRLQWMGWLSNSIDCIARCCETAFAIENGLHLWLLLLLRLLLRKLAGERCGWIILLAEHRHRQSFPDAVQASCHVKVAGRAGRCGTCPGCST